MAEKEVDPKTGKPKEEGILAALQETVASLTAELKTLSERQAKTAEKTDGLWDRLFG